MTRRGWLLFAAMSVIWGVPYLLIKVAVEQVPPVELVFLRTALGSLALLPLALRQDALRPALRAWRPLLLFAALEMAGPWWLLSTAEQRLSSSLTGLLVATVPLAAALLGRALGDADRLDRVRVAGLALGMAGTGVLLGFDVHADDRLAVGAVALTVLGYAAGPMVVNRALANVPSAGVNTAALAATALLYLPLAAPHLAGDPVPDTRALLAVLALGLVCTALALVLFFALIAEAGPQRALVITFVNPAVAVVLGIVLLGEPFTAGTAAGFPLVLAGCVLATRRSRVRPRTRPVAASARLSV